MKAFIAFTLILASGLQASAGRQGRTHYETLQMAFQRADVPARTRDFDAQNWDRCLYVDINDPNNLRETHVRTVRMSYPDRGPMFPGRSETRVDVFNDRVIDAYKFSFFQNSYIYKNSEYFLQVVDGPGWTRMNVYGRMDRDILVFHVATGMFVGQLAPLNPRVFGYCWNQHSSPLPPPRPPSDPVPPPPSDEPEIPAPEHPAPQPSAVIPPIMKSKPAAKRATPAEKTEPAATVSSEEAPSAANDLPTLPPMPLEMQRKSTANSKPSISAKP